MKRSDGELEGRLDGAVIVERYLLRHSVSSSIFVRFTCVLCTSKFSVGGIMKFLIVLYFLIVDASTRCPKKKKSSPTGAGNPSLCRPSGLRFRDNKSSIQTAIELKAKRDIMPVSPFLLLS